MTWLRIVRGELRKLTSTKMPWAFLAVLVVLSGTTAAAVIWGTDMDGSKDFISTADDQRSLMAFGANAMLLSGLLGAVFVAREYGHGTVVPTFLATPRRDRAVLAQLTAVAVAGALIGLVGTGLTMVGVALALPTSEHSFMVSARALAAVLAAAAFAGAAGAVLGAGIGTLVRNIGGAVTGVVLVLLIGPPLLVQLINDAASWIPSTLAMVLAGVTHEVGRPSAIVALAAWASVPAVIGLMATRRRDVV
jgi:ABC-type transport system involved in multi-copper enzyme maturation permease subunit